jgi:hypothetical protein
MDHHCPFTMNCAGHGTYGHFVFFLGYATLGLLYASAISLEPFFDCWLMPPRAATHTMCAFFGNQSLAFVGAVSLAVATGSLLLLHAVLLLADLSTLAAVALLQREGPAALLWQLWVDGVQRRRGCQPGSRARRLLAVPYRRWVR